MIAFIAASPVRGFFGGDIDEFRTPVAFGAQARVPIALGQLEIFP